MASNNLHILSSKLPSFSTSKPHTLFSTIRPRSLIPTSFSRLISHSSTATTIFTWDDVIRVSQPEYPPHHSSYLTGFFEKVKACNRNTEMLSEFIPFVLEDCIVGYVHNEFMESLRRFEDVFVLRQSSDHGGRFGCYLSLNELLKTPEDRTKAVGDVIRSLGELIPGIRNELYPVSSSHGALVHFSLERAAAPYFGIKAYGVHMNGYVERDGDKFLWIGKRSQVKPTYPGMLDHLVAGGLPHGISCGENIIKECEEEAGIPKSLSKGAIPVGAVSYMDIDGWRFKRDVLFCYDLKLPDDFVPGNRDGEVESFRLIPVKNVANIIRRTAFFKPNCSLVIMDFLFRHGLWFVDEYSESLDCEARNKRVVGNCIFFSSVVVMWMFAAESYFDQLVE